MKISVTASTNTGLEAEVDLRFGRAPYFAVVDSETMDVDFINNSATKVASGAGVKGAQTIVDQNVDVVISGNFGPKAFSALKAANLKLYVFEGGTIQNAIEEFKNKSLDELSNPTNEAHSGLK
jgi:predicted Fe-Mo cluster-binding NifX family protein